VIAVVCSRDDEASMAIRDALLASADWSGDGPHRHDEFVLRTFHESHLELERVAAAFDDPDFLVFASKHAGETGPLLTAHFTGNFGPADHGGREGELAAAAPNAQKAVLGALRERAPEGYEAGVECTHHGPSAVGCPSMFVELGSSESEWTDPAGAEAVAGAILSLAGAPPRHERTVVSFGDDHYAPRPTRVIAETDWRVGHVGSEWALTAMGEPDPEVINRAFERSGAARALVAGERPELRSVVGNLGYRVVSETYLRETTDVPLALAEQLERRLRTVDAGLRFGGPATAREGAGEYAVRSLPDDLLAECAGIDRERTGELVAASALAYTTAENGTLVEGRGAFPDAGDYDRLVADLAGLLGEKYDAVEREGDEVIAVREAFDPEAARTLGISQGPAFGTLAAGEAVEVNGEEIPPEAVRSEVERRFPV
jgi:D-aminoacyl-tRNA deacylase